MSDISTRRTEAAAQFRCGYARESMSESFGEQQHTTLSFVLLLLLLLLLC